MPTQTERAMIESIEFTNFKALRKTTVPLAPFTLLLGPNSSGKTTVLQALHLIANLAAQGDDGRGNLPAQPGLWSSLRSVTAEDRSQCIEIHLGIRLQNLVIGTFRWVPNGQVGRELRHEDKSTVPPDEAGRVLHWLSRMRTYALDSSAIAQPVHVHAEPLNPSGQGLPAVLDDLKDNHPERWELLLAEMRRWLPEYDHIQFDKPQAGQKGVALRTR